MSESVTPEATRRRRRSPLEDEDLLQEILLRLPPQPSSLPRASAVCKLWRGLLTDPKFLRRFRDRHREPPLLGFFETRVWKIQFRSILNPPDRIPPKRFDLLRRTVLLEDDVLDCRHGRVLLLDRLQGEVAVCDPLTGEQRHLSIPPGLKRRSISGAVIYTARDDGHVHVSCRSSPFKVVLVSIDITDDRPLARVYSSDTRIWGSLIATAAPALLMGNDRPATLVGNALYWLPLTGCILEFDLDRQSLAVIARPPGLNEHHEFQIIKADDGDVGLAVLSESSFEMWHRKINCQGVTAWLLRKTVDMHSILGISPQIKRNMERLLGYDEDTDMIFIYMDGGVHMVHLRSMQHKKKLYETDRLANFHPFKSLFAPGIAIVAGYDGPEVLHSAWG